MKVKQRFVGVLLMILVSGCLCGAGCIAKEATLDLGNGVTIDFDRILHPGASAIVPISQNNNLILIKQYRHAVGGDIWEIPAGTLNPDEKPLECAKRELAEETGFSANVWQPLGVITPLPGYSD